MTTSKHSRSKVSELTSNLEDATLFANSAQKAHQAKQQAPAQSMEQLLAEAMEEVANRELGQPSPSSEIDPDNPPETEEDGIRAEAIRRLRVIRSRAPRK